MVFLFVTVIDLYLSFLLVHRVCLSYWNSFIPCDVFLIVWSSKSDKVYFILIIFQKPSRVSQTWTRIISYSQMHTSLLMRSFLCVIHVYMGATGYTDFIVNFSSKEPFKNLNNRYLICLIYDSNFISQRKLKKNMLNIT